METRNAAEPDQTKPAGSPQRRRRDSAAKPEPDTTTSVDQSPDKRQREGSADAPEDSDAETIVLPGKDGHSPSKARKVRQEDKSDGDAEGSKDGEAGLSGERESNGNASKPDLGPEESKQQRPGDASDKARDESAAGKSSLSSVPASPDNRRRRRSVDSLSSLSDNEKTTVNSSAKPSPRFKERALPPKRKASRNESDDDEEDDRKARRPRRTSNSVDAGRPSRERRTSQSKSYVERPSVSPPVRSHRRSASSQFASSNGPNHKKKRLPPPLNTTEYQSDESSASGSPYPRSGKAKSMASSGAVDPSSAKKQHKKKHLDAHGQTLLARACARGEFEAAKQRLRERPEDLNVADFAGNTPLQIAAINGCEDIVKLLIDAGCNLDCVNYDRDTPLLDAVDNGHLDVVKLLLGAGVNPRKANVNGEEPIDRLTEDTDNVEEIRTALIEAKKRYGGRTKTSEDREAHLSKQDAPDSPRRSPAGTTNSSRRGGNVRSQKTRNDLLYQPLNDKTLRQAAGRGDEEMVARVLQVKTEVSDPEPMVAAARGGHDLVIQLLLGLGGADPDPAPLSSQPGEFSTPILAAIGQENFKVLELLLEQPQVDPTKRYKGETYYEIARRRQGTNWKEEEQLLKDAYDAHKTSGKLKTKSPGRREREKEREEKRARREERTDRPQKRDAHSPEPNSEVRKKLSAKLGSPRAKRRTESQSHPSDKERLRKKDDRMASVQGSDREGSPSLSQKHSKISRNDSEVAMSSDGEAAKPRRKLISKGELRGEQRRRSSVHSNPSTAKDQPSSPHESRNEDTTDKSKMSEKYHDRAKALKREGSRDPGANSEHSAKRHRASVTPDRAHNGDKDEGEAPSKKRRLESEGSEKRKKRLSEHDSRKGGVDMSSNNGVKKSTADDKSEAAPGDSSRNGSRRPSGADSGVPIKSEEHDVEMPDADSSKALSSKDSNPINRESEKAEPDELARKQAALADEAAKKKREIEEAKEAEARQQRDAEEAEKKRKAEEEATRKREEAEEEQRKKQQQEELKKQAEELKARKESEEKARREEEERRRHAEEQQQKEEEERKKRAEEEERIRKEREAEEARRKREEDERKDRERREETERKRAAERRAREQQEKARLEQLEKARLDKLPPLLRWLDTCPNPKNRVFAEKFATMQGVRYDTIRPEANHTPEGREQWVLNTHAALLLGEKDLALTRCEFSIPQSKVKCR